MTRCSTSLAIRDGNAFENHNELSLHSCHNAYYPTVTNAGEIPFSISCLKDNIICFICKEYNTLGFVGIFFNLPERQRVRGKERIIA